MKRWLAATTGLALTGGFLQAQTPPPSNSGYLVIRVKIANTEGGIVPASPFPGGSSFPGGPGGGSPMFPGGPGGGSPMFPGSPGGPGGRPPGGPGGMFPGGPGGSSGGPPGGFSGSGFPQSGGQSAPTVAADERSVFALIPVKSVAMGAVYPRNTSPDNPRHMWAKHEYGKSLLFDDGTNIQVYAIPGTVEQDIKKKYTAWTKDRKPDVLLELISYALSTDYVELAITYSNELEKLVVAQKTTASRIMNFVEAYRELKLKFEEVAPTPPEAEEWRKRLKASAIAEDKHYALIHWGEQAVSAETVNRRLAELDRNFRAFYLWHAVQGKTLKFPDKRLVVVLANRPTDVDELRPKLDGMPVVSDAFYSPAHNLVVLSPMRLDEAGKSFSELAKAKYQDGWNRDELLKGKAPVVKGGKFDDLYRTMTYALVDRALEDEAAHAAITREGSRQLYSALGILPQHVILPKWIENGVGNLLFKPKDVGVVKVAGGKNGMAVGLWAGYGSPNYVLLREWKEMWTRKELAAPPKDLLLNVLMDHYFDAIRTGVDPDPAPVALAPVGNGGFAPPPGGNSPPGGGEMSLPNSSKLDSQAPQRPQPPGFPGGPGGNRPLPGGGQGYPTGPGGSGLPFPGGGGGTGVIESGSDKGAIRTKLETKAQVTSWALVYFLAKTNTPGLHKFFAKLNDLPRDMRIDRKVVIELFAREFNLMNPELTAINEVAFKEFAELWVNYMNGVQASWYSMALTATSADSLGQGGAGGAGLPPRGPSVPGGGGSSGGGDN
jgi:hypothetical protein